MNVTISTLPPWPGWPAGFLALGLLCATYLLYVLLRQRRYRRPEGPGFSSRVEGRLVGRLGAARYRTLPPFAPPPSSPRSSAMPARPASGLTEPVAPDRADEVLLVEQAGRTIAVIAGSAARGARAGCFLTADGVAATLICEDSLYRETAGRPALLAGRVVFGRWPELRWLRVPVAIGCVIWLLGVACWLCSTPPSGPSGRLFQRAPVEDVVPTGP